MFSDSVHVSWNNAAMGNEACSFRRRAQAVDEDVAGKYFAYVLSVFQEMEVRQIWKSLSTAPLLKGAVFSARW